MKAGEVRPIAICVFRKGNMIFVAEDYDPDKGELFYRPLGGKIDFGEHSYQAITREIREEIGAEIMNLRYLTTIENIFTFNRKDCHEIVLVYEGEFADRMIYEEAEIEGHEDNGSTFKAMWKSLAEFQSKKAPLYPEGLLELLTRESNRQTDRHRYDLFRDTHAVKGDIVGHNG